MLTTTDPIADMLTRIRNAVMSSKSEVSMPSSKLKVTIAEQLKKAGYISNMKIEKSSPRDTLVITIHKDGENTTINEITRLSTPGRRLYAGVNEIPRIKSGRGIVLVSTSKGVMTGDEAKKARLGGELICKIY
jgi:small subunit ribosomal protein S8